MTGETPRFSSNIALIFAFILTLQPGSRGIIPHIDEPTTTAYTLPTLWEYIRGMA